MEKDIYIALGSNIGDREGNLLRAVAAIGQLPDSKVTALSSFYDTEPVGMESAENFLNAVLKLESSLSPDELLNELMRIETAVFRRERVSGIESRRMDLDLLLYGEALIDRPPTLVIPHPRLHQRRFVLAPLAEIASDYCHPCLHKTISELLAGLDENSQVRKI